MTKKKTIKNLDSLIVYRNLVIILSEICTKSNHISIHYTTLFINTTH